MSPKWASINGVQEWKRLLLIFFSRKVYELSWPKWEYSYPRANHTMTPANLHYAAQDCCMAQCQGALLTNCTVFYPALVRAHSTRMGPEGLRRLTHLSLSQPGTLLRNSRCTADFILKNNTQIRVIIIWFCKWWTTCHRQWWSWDINLGTNGYTCSVLIFFAGYFFSHQYNDLRV